MTSDESVALVGLDGLSPDDARRWGFGDAIGDHSFRALGVETTAHTCPSWNAIFSGLDSDDRQIYDFFKVPDVDSMKPVMLADESDERFSYEDVRTDRLLWERDDTGPMEVVSAPVVLPTFSTLDNHPGPELTWCGSRREVERAMLRLTAMTARRDRVVTVFPLPDKPNHMTTNDDKDYGDDDRSRQMGALADKVDSLTDKFDRWMVVSDHGRPGPREYVEGGDFWVPSHGRTGVVASNCVDVGGHTNVSVYDAVVELFGGEVDA